MFWQNYDQYLDLRIYISGSTAAEKNLIRFLKKRLVWFQLDTNKILCTRKIKAGFFGSLS